MLIIYVLHGKELYFQNPEKKSILQSFPGKTRRNAKTLISIHFCVHINWCCWWRQWNCQSNCGLKMTWDWWKMALLLSTCQLYFLQVQLLLVNTYRKGNHRHRKSHPDILRQGKLDFGLKLGPCIQREIVKYPSLIFYSFLALHILWCNTRQWIHCKPHQATELRHQSVKEKKVFCEYEFIRRT